MCKAEQYLAFVQRDTSDARVLQPAVSELAIGVLPDAICPAACCMAVVHYQLTFCIVPDCSMQHAWSVAVTATAAVLSCAVVFGVQAGSGSR